MTVETSLATGVSWVSLFISISCPSSHLGLVTETVLSVLLLGFPVLWQCLGPGTFQASKEGSNQPDAQESWYWQGGEEEICLLCVFGSQELQGLIMTGRGTHTQLALSQRMTLPHKMVLDMLTILSGVLSWVYQSQTPRNMSNFISPWDKHGQRKALNSFRIQFWSIKGLNLLQTSVRVF